MSEEILEDVALHVRAELAEVDRVELVDHLLEHVRIDDLQHRVAEVLGDLRLVLHERGHVGEDLVADEVAQVVAASEAPLGPTVALGLPGEETHPAAGAETASELAGRLFLVEELQVDEVGDLLDVGDGIRDPARPEDVGDPGELAPQTLVHRVLVSSRCRKRRRSAHRRPFGVPLPRTARSPCRRHRGSRGAARRGRRGGRVRWRCRGS